MVMVVKYLTNHYTNSLRKRKEYTLQISIVRILYQIEIINW